MTPTQIIVQNYHTEKQASVLRALVKGFSSAGRTSGKSLSSFKSNLSGANVARAKANLGSVDKSMMDLRGQPSLFSHPHSNPKALMTAPSNSYGGFVDFGNKEMRYLAGQPDSGKYITSHITGMPNTQPGLKDALTSRYKDLMGSTRGHMQARSSYADSLRNKATAWQRLLAGLGLGGLGGGAVYMNQH